MRFWKTLLTVWLVALWPLVTVHCKVEQLPGLQFLACATHSDTDAHQDTDCTADGCAFIENGFYKTEESQVSAPASPQAVPDVALIDFKPALSELASSSFPQPAPVTELNVTWQFVFRAAAPPRAPTFVS